MGLSIFYVMRKYIFRIYYERLKEELEPMQIVNYTDKISLLMRSLIYSEFLKLPM